MKISICFTADKSYLAHMTTAIQSILENNQSNFFEIFILNSNLNRYALKKIKESFKSYPNIKIKDFKIDTSILESFPLSKHFKKEVYYRLFMAEQINIKKILYLDSDLIVCEPLDELWNIEINDYVLAAVRENDFNRHQDLSMDSNSKYFNTGVMLLNLEKWKSESIQERCIKFINEKRDYIQFPDQDSLNAILNGNWLEINPKFNVKTDYYDKSNQNNEILKAIIKPNIVHFTGATKPWHYLNKHPFKKNYWIHRNKTNFKSYKADDLSVFILIKSFLPIKLKQFLKKITNSFFSTVLF